MASKKHIEKEPTYFHGFKSNDEVGGIDAILGTNSNLNKFHSAVQAYFEQCKHIWGIGILVGTVQLYCLKRKWYISRYI